MKATPELHRLHFIGIGGAGMSSLAEVMVGFGFTVSGSDARESAGTDHLRRLGIRVFIGHAESQVGDAQAVVYSAAVSPENPERAAALKLGIPLIRRADWLGKLTAAHRSLLIAGTHGKSTTTAMLGSIYHTAGYYPTMVGGAAPRGNDISARAGQGHTLIAEADEYDRAFLSFSPTVAVVTNVDVDHLDCYGTEAALHAAFAQFLGKLPPQGLAVLQAADPVLLAMRPTLHARTVTFGFEPAADYQAVNRESSQGTETFELRVFGKTLGQLQIGVPGEHNIQNALAAAAVALEEGLDFQQVAKGLLAFSGVKRRLEKVGEKQGVVFFDDYGHHPTEVEASLKALRALSPKRLVLAFQPHLYSRTQQHAQAFGMAMGLADISWVTRVYAAREKPIPGVEGDSIVDVAVQNRYRCQYLPNWEESTETIASQLEPGDLFVTMGAGDIEKLGPMVMGALS
jgi:UDP-N-acetylmuramate--alanine ligase